MNKVDFIYNCHNIIIQCNEEDKMKDIIDKFCYKAKINKNNKYYLYNGQIINPELIFKKCANSLDRSRNYMNIIVIEEQDSNNSLIKSNFIICPECYESAFFSIKNFKINIMCYKCGHQTKDLQLMEFEKTQYKDESKIKCDECGNSKCQINKNEFFMCFNCQKYLCLECKKNHNISHFIKDYEEKHFFCKYHFDSYLAFCSDCNIDICNKCEDEHKNHKIIFYNNIIPDVNIIKSLEINDTKEKIFELKTIVTGMINQLNQLNNYLDTYFEIYNNIICNFDKNRINYSLLQNVDKIKKYNDNFIRNLTEIVKDNNIKSQFTSIINLHTKIDFKKLEDKLKIPQNIESEINNEYNKDKIKRYNQLIDKYENFDIKEIKELKSFTTKYDVKNLLILDDLRILTHQEYQDSERNIISKLCVYSDKNGFLCDLNFDIEETENIFQMDDGNLILNGIQLQIIKIKKNNIEEVWKNEHNKTLIIKKRLLNEKFFVEKRITKNEGKHDNIWSFLANSKYNYGLFTYENNKLIFCKDLSSMYKKEEENNVCQINEDELVFYVTQDNYSKNVLLFYDIKSDKLIASLKVGDGMNGCEMFFINSENLIISGLNSIILIDPKKREIKNEFQYEIYPSEFFLINEKIFLYKASYHLIQYEFDDSNNIKLKGKEKFRSQLMSKYPGNKLIIYWNNKITIYG